MNNSIQIDTEIFEIKNKRKIGEGSYGDVYEENNKKAVKIFKDKINTNFDVDPIIFREIEISLKMGYLGFSPKVNKIYCDSEIGFEMNLCDVTLHDVIKNHTLNSISENKKSLNNFDISYELILNNIDYIIFRLVYALAYAQQYKILHRDVKPENIFLQKVCHTTTKPSESNELNESNEIICPFEVYLGDWGLSTMKTIDEMYYNTRSVQTIWYRCPEHLMEIDEYMNNETIDMWSVGIIMMEILEGKEGFVGHDTKTRSVERIINLFGIPKNKIMFEWIKLKVPFAKLKFDDHIGEVCNKFYGKKTDCENFIKCCLKMSPLDRIAPIDALKHPFLSKFSSKIPKNIQNLLSIDDKFLQFVRIDSYDRINIVEILKKNQGYIKNQNCTYLFLDSFCNKIIYGRHKFFTFYQKLIKLIIKDDYSVMWSREKIALSRLQLLSLCMSYTDKIMELYQCSFLFDENFGIAVCSLAYGTMSDEFPDNYIIKQYFHQKTFDGKYMIINKHQIVNWIKLILKLFKYKLPIKTFMIYKEIIQAELFDTCDIGTLEMYYLCCNHFIDNDQMIKLSSEQIFGKILEILHESKYVESNKTHYFNDYLKYINMIKNKYNSILDSNENIKFQKKIKFNDGYIQNY